jgi:hypothetical protein
MIDALARVNEAEVDILIDLGPLLSFQMGLRLNMALTWEPGLVEIEGSCFTWIPGQKEMKSVTRARSVASSKHEGWC